MLIHEGPYHKFARICFGAVSAIGLLISFWAQVVSLVGLDPRAFFPRIWIVEPVLTLVLFPLILTVFRNGVKRDPFDFPRRARLTLYTLLGYYVLHFYLFLYRASIDLKTSQAWQMLSAGWLLIFALALLYYAKPTPPAHSRSK